MEKEIIIGRDGNQPFTIKKEMNGVSREHAKITITDNGNWYLEDLGSSNGTFIRDEKTGELIPANDKIRISPMTFIFLGPDNSRGCCFFAKQAVSYGDFTEEYEFLNTKEDEFDEKLDNLENLISREKKLIFLINVLVAIVSLIPQIDSDLRMNLLRIVPVVSTGFAAFYDASGKKDTIKEMREKFHHCPNPLCSHKLKTSEIRNYKCSKCKK